IVVREEIAATEDPWKLLARLEAVGLPSGLRRVAAAAALLGDWPANLSEPQSRWLQWLAEDSWEQRHFVEAAVLTNVGFGRGSAGLPRPSMVLLAAAQST